MIEQETLIKMRCDKCGGLLMDDYGHIIKLHDVRLAYLVLRQRAIDLGWECEFDFPKKEFCLCPLCQKECADD